MMVTKKKEKKRKKGVQGNLSLQYREWPPCQFGSKAERLHPVKIFLYIHGCPNMCVQ